MSLEAQNALLKLLEEPPANVYFLLAAHSTAPLLPTIMSRVQILQLKNIEQDQSRQLLDRLDAKLDAALVQKILFLGEGLPAELTRLATDNAYFESQAKSMGNARKFVEKTTYDRLILINKYASDRDLSLVFVDMIGRITTRLAVSHDVSIAQRLEIISNTLDNIKANGHIKTQLMCLAYNYA
jgi:hypothetical protein